METPTPEEDYIDWSAAERLTRVDNGRKKRIVVLGCIFLVLAFLFVAFDKIIKASNRVVLVGDPSKKANKNDVEESPIPEVDETSPVETTTPAIDKGEPLVDDVEIPPFDENEPLVVDDKTTTPPGDDELDLATDDETLPGDDELDLATDDETLPGDDELDLATDDETNLDDAGLDLASDNETNLDDESIFGDDEPQTVADNGALPDLDNPQTVADNGTPPSVDNTQPVADNGTPPVVDNTQSVAANDPSVADDATSGLNEVGSFASDDPPGIAVSNSLPDASDALASDDDPLSSLPTTNDDPFFDETDSTSVAIDDVPDDDPSSDDPLVDFGDPESSESGLDVFGDEPEVANNETPVVETPVAETPVVDVEQARAELAQLDFQFRQVMNAESDVDALWEALDDPLAQTREFVEKAPSELADSASALLAEIESVYSDIESNLDFYRRLETLDAAALDGKESRDFFAPWREDMKPENSAKRDDPASESVASYNRDFSRVAETLAAIDVVDKWNDFMQENGERLERFHVSQDDAKLGLNFISEFRVKPGVPEEIKSVEKREPQWRFESTREFPTQRKVVLLLEDELKQKYWTYAPSRDMFYYLPAAPREGVNNYVSKADGTFGKVTIPADAPELGSEISPQKQFLGELEETARQIPDSLRNDDVAQWYRKWCDFLQKLQETKNLDPILQYKFFQQTALFLQSSDYYFSTRLEPLLRVLNAPQLDENTLLDRFQTETAELRSLRSLAISRVDFLPQGHLKVDKTTDELNSSVERFATLYRRVGWLDRGFNGEWRLRKPNGVETPAGDLYVLYAEADGVEPRWFKVGSSDGRQVTLNVASDSIPRGSIVLCRIPLSSCPTVAARSSVDALFTR